MNRKGEMILQGSCSHRSHRRKKAPALLVVTPEANFILIFTYSMSCRVDVATCVVQYNTNDVNGCNGWYSVHPNCCQTQ